jgi:hypothetical protein
MELAFMGMRAFARATGIGAIMFPETKEQRRAGMAALRRKLFAAHSRLANDPRLSPRQQEIQQGSADFTARIQREKGELS